MLKKKFLSLLFVLVLSNAFTESIRDYVCIVKGNLSSKNQEILTQYKESLETSGYSRYAQYIESFLMGTFGSGFIYYSNETPFIITNQHVISEYETVNVVFENDDGSLTEFKDLKVIASDENIDIAIIALPENFNRPGLELVSSGLSDGDDVWSAGFPGLNGEPMWQLGKGIISNSRAIIKELINPEISTIIQHTAEIDGGNSGGPLLIKNSEAASGYSVIGINTWKASYRQNTNFAIPANLIQKFVSENAQGNGTIEFKSRINSFVKAMGNDDNFYDLTRFISNEMISEVGQNVFKKTISIAPESIRSAVIDTFAYNPLEGMKCSIAYWIWNEFRTEEGFETPTVGTPTENAEIYSLVFNSESKSPIDCKWIKEGGQWKLSEFNGSITSKSKSSNSSSSSKKSKGSFYIEQVGVYEFSVGYLSSLNLDKNGYELQLAVNMQCFRLGLFLQNQTIPYVRKNTTGENINKEEKASLFGFVIGGQVPMLIDSFIVEPFAYIRTGFVNFGKLSETNLDILMLGYSCGLNLGYEVSTDFSPFLTLKYNCMPFKIKQENHEKSDLKSHEFSIGLGFKF